MNTQYTPGPWKADGYHVRQSGQRGTRSIADVCYTGPHHTPPDEYPKSCQIADEANARLIASAPDLLAALIEATECLIDSGYDHKGNKVKYMRAIIAKATGKETA